MSARVFRFHFDFISPYSYLAWCRVGAFAHDHDLRVEPKPTLFAALLNHLDHKGPGEIPEKRAYMFKDCQRLAAQLDVPFVPVFSHPFNPLPSLRATLLDMDDPDAYEAALVGLYGDETLDLATDLIDGEVRFFGLQSPGLNLEGCDLHQRLLKQYEKAHAAG